MSEPKKKGFLQRIGFVESAGESAGEPAPSIEALQAQIAQMAGGVPTTTPATGTDLSGTEFVSIEEVYNMGELNSIDRSIFKVNDFLAALPDMPLDAKRKTLEGIIPVSGLSIAELMNDAQARLTLLASIDVQTQQDTADIVATKEAEIEQLTREVEQLRADINVRKLGQEKQTHVLNEEAVSINGIMKFIQP